MIVPLLLAWNRTPRFTALVSAASTAPDGAASCQMLHGHCATAPVLKLHENGLLIATPELFCAPDTVAVYVVLAASELDGVNVATVSALLKLTEPATEFPPESFSVNDTVFCTTAWENVAVGATETGLPVDPAEGVTVVTAGGTLLATGTFGGESASGWQELDFSAPVSVTAGTTYVASYHTDTGHYAITANGLGSAVTNGPLTALASGGVYAYGSADAFPSDSFNASNYWVDVVYSP